MVIQYHGDACVRLAGKLGAQEFTVLIDPYDAKATGLKPLRLSAVDLVISTTSRLPSFEGGPYGISGPGEYEVCGVMVAGISVGETTIYRLEAEELTLAHLGNLKTALSESALEQLDGVGVLFVPVGGHGILTAKQAAEVIKLIEPRVVIPIQYKVSGVKLPHDGPEAFCKEMGCSAKAAEEKLKISKKDLPQDDMRVQLLAVS